MTYWLSPFRHRTRWLPTVGPNGEPTSYRVPLEFYVANVAPSKAMKRQSVEIVFPAAVIRKANKAERSLLLKQKIAEALATFV